MFASLEMTKLWTFEK